jgi:hypothetical protein
MSDNPIHAAGPGDRLAVGGKSAPFPSSSNVQQIKWDYTFLSDDEFGQRYGITKQEYESNGSKEVSRLPELSETGKSSVPEVRRPAEGSVSDEDRRAEK